MKLAAATLALLVTSMVYAEMGVSSLNWMTGSWIGSMGPSTLEELWAKPQGNSIQASIRIVAGDSVVVHETVIINETQDGIKLFLQQWSPDFQPVAPATVMDMTQQTENSISFESSGDTMVQKLTYQRSSEDSFDILITTKNQPEFKIELSPQS